jgi:Tol biopolymer transport system component/DNA-binding winged helix-turn-helix (wHTH) protein
MTEPNKFKLRQCTILADENTLVIEQNGKSFKQALQPKFIELICYLAKHYPRVIPRSELIENIWDGNEYVGEKALTNAIWHLRKCFTEHQQPEIIETIRKVGYKLSVEPIWLSPPPSNKSTQTDIQHKNARPIYASMTLVFITLTLLLNLVWYFYSEWKPIKERTIKNITNEPGSELFVSPSPDGQHVVYAWTDTSGATDLYLKHTKQADLPTKKLTHDGLIQGISVWAPSGQYLYFAKKSRPDRTCSIIQLDITALEETPIADCPFTGGYYYVDSSPDGKILAFHGREKNHQNSGIYFLYLQEDNRIERFSCEGDCQFKDRDFSFSPDSKSIAITRRTGRFRENLIIANLSSKQEIQITNDVEDIVGLTWSPDGQHIVYGTQKADMRQGFIYNLITQITTPLNIAGFSYPEFAKDTGELFFQQRLEQYHVAKLDLGNTVATSPFPLVKSTFSHNYPDYSKVNNKLAFSSNQSGHYELWMSDLDGKNRQQLTQLNRGIQYPKWSHDGKKVAFLAASKTESGDALYIYDVPSKRIIPIETGHYAHNRPTWSADDSQLISAVTVDGSTNLYAIDITNGNMNKLTSDGGRLGFLLSDGTLVYSRISGGLWKKNIYSDDKRQSVLSSNQHSSAYSWQLEKDTIYFQNRFYDKTFLSQLDLTNNKITPILQLPSGYLSSSANLSYVEKHNRLILPLREFPQSDIKQLIHPMLH